MSSPPSSAYRPVRTRPSRLARRARFVLRLGLATVLVGGATLGSRAIDDAQVLRDHGKRIFASAWTWSSYYDRAEVSYSYKWLGKRYYGNAYVDLNDYPTVETAQLLPLVILPQSPDKRILGWSTYRLVEQTRSFWFGWSIGLALLIEVATFALDRMTRRQRAALEEEARMIASSQPEAPQEPLRQRLGPPGSLPRPTATHPQLRLAEIDGG